MLQYKNARFYCGKSSFALPEGICLLESLATLNYENGLNFSDPSATVKGFVTFEHCTYSAKQELIQTLEEKPDDIKNIKEYVADGRVGYYSEHVSNGNNCLDFMVAVDACCQNEDEEEINLFEVYADWSQKATVSQDILNQYFWALVNSLKTE